MAKDAGVRSLEQLEGTASTARVLNLRAVHRLKHNDPEYKANPLFKNATLNASIIVKHRLRGNEVRDAPGGRQIATKLLIPIDTANLSAGARYVFVGQDRYQAAIAEAIGMSSDEAERDLRTLKILDEIPTLDPFLLREQLKRYGLDPARCYFELSTADMERMFAFARREIAALVRLSLGGQSGFEQAGTLTEKILSNSGEADLEPLRTTMQLDKQQFEEGAFCWKAFLYYKWQLTELLPRVGPVLQQIAVIAPTGPQNDEEAHYIATAKEKLRAAIIASCRRVKSTLDIYDEAYRGLTDHSDPAAFREFLLRAPSLFNDLGERLGGLEHIVSFWLFRFPREKRTVVTAAELSSVFMDFEGSVGADCVARAREMPKPEIIDAR